MKVLVSVVEAELGLFDVEIEESSGQSAVFGEAHLSEAPKGFDAVDVVGSASKLVSAVLDTEVTLVTQVDEPVVTFPPIGVDDCLVSDLSPYDVLQCGSGAIFQDISEDFATAFVDPNDGHFPISPSSSFPSHAPCTEVTFVNLDFSGEGRFAGTFLGDAGSDRQANGDRRWCDERPPARRF